MPCVPGREAEMRYAIIGLTLLIGCTSHPGTAIPDYALEAILSRAGANPVLAPGGDGVIGGTPTDGGDDGPPIIPCGVGGQYYPPGHPCHDYSSR